MAVVTTIDNKKMVSGDDLRYYYNREQLVRRGWTRMMRRTLGEPDAWMQNLCWLTPLWGRYSVEHLERDPIWQGYRKNLDEMIKRKGGHGHAEDRARHAPSDSNF